MISRRKKFSDFFIWYKKLKVEKQPVKNFLSFIKRCLTKPDHATLSRKKLVIFEYFLVTKVIKKQKLSFKSSQFSS